MRLLGVTLAAALAVGCDSARTPPPRDRVEEALAELRAYEHAARNTTNFATQSRDDALFGPEPYGVEPLSEERAVGLLRARGEVVILDRQGLERARIATVAGATGLAVADGEIAVVSEGAPRIVRVRASGDRLERLSDVPIDAARSLCDVAWGPGGVLYAIDEWTDTLFVAAPRGDDAPREGDGAYDISSHPSCNQPVSLERKGGRLLIACLVDHALAIVPIDEKGTPEPARGRRIVHDGPIWSSALRDMDDEVTHIAVGGVEDHPLDRSKGYFGNIDSFVFLYEIRGYGEPVKLAETNVSALGVITPKALAWLGERLLVTGYGGDKAALLQGGDLSVLEVHALPPGTRDIALLGSGLYAHGLIAGPAAPSELLLANPLIDAWLRWRPGAPATIHPEARASSARAELLVGEVMLFTRLMAPENKSDGSLSRFTCETCHLEGYTDGRTHHTGRGAVHATTKPLFGLFNNKPHFTRALDPDLTRVSHAEFRVAGAGSGHDPWFSLDASEHDWLVDALGRATKRSGALSPAEPLDAALLRKSVLSYLMANAHRPNPLAARRSRFGDPARAGAALFRDRCASCHAPRLVADDPSSEVAFERWESMVLGGGAIVWASSGYHKTGVEPYVHTDGARTTSLRRLYKKRPYFTNGSAASVVQVLVQARWEGERFHHQHGPLRAAALSEREQKALLAFLELL